MPLVNPKSPYNSILRYIKAKGVRVFHRALKDTGGLFDYKKVIITISKEFRNTWAGCGLLLHEFQHFIDWREGKFRKFFETKLDYTPENVDLVIKAETSAVNGAIKMLKMWGVDYSPEETTQTGYDKSIKFWIKYYFNKEV